MSQSALLQYAAFLRLVTLLVKPVGRSMARVFSGERTLLDPLLRPAEHPANLHRADRVGAELLPCSGAGTAARASAHGALDPAAGTTEVAP